MRGRQVTDNDLQPDLQALGFSDHEARAYLALYRLQPATAYEVSKLAGLPKANAYSVLESLSKKEAAQPISESPVRYIAVAPNILFERIASATSKRCAKLIEAIPAVAPPGDRGYVWSITGEDATSAKIESMIDSATSHIWIKTSETILMPHREALQRAADRGVSVIVILFGTQTDKFEFGGKSRVYLHEGNGISVGIAPQLVTVTVDFKEALVTMVGGQQRGSYTQNKPIVHLAETMLRHEVYIAEIFENFGGPIQETFGPALLELRRQYLPQWQVEALQNLIGFDRAAMAKVKSAVAKTPRKRVKS
jgi:sugar-specific transcriptional regulator TrmB